MNYALLEIQNNLNKQKLKIFSLYTLNFRLQTVI